MLLFHCTSARLPHIFPHHHSHCHLTHVFPPSPPTSYLAYNGHSSSYTWKRTDSNAVARILNMRETLDANGIPDESLAFDALNIDEDQFIPIIHLYFSDDLTVA